MLLSFFQSFLSEKQATVHMEYLGEEISGACGKCYSCLRPEDAFEDRNCQEGGSKLLRAFLPSKMLFSA
jgi:hypothetical protein